MQYEPLDYYDQEQPFSPALAYIQAGHTLDLAAQVAVKSKNWEALLNIAVLWGKLAESMSGGGGIEELNVTSKPMVGFSIQSGEEIEDDEYSE